MPAVHSWMGRKYTHSVVFNDIEYQHVYCKQPYKRHNHDILVIQLRINVNQCFGSLPTVLHLQKKCFRTIAWAAPTKNPQHCHHSSMEDVLNGTIEVSLEDKASGPEVLIYMDGSYLEFQRIRLYTGELVHWLLWCGKKILGGFEFNDLTKGLGKPIAWWNLPNEGHPNNPHTSLWLTEGINSRLLEREAANSLGLWRSTLTTGRFERRGQQTHK